MTQTEKTVMSASQAKDNVVDVAVNIFAKPYQTALAILSLLRHSKKHIGVIWLQFEPIGSKYDALSPYLIHSYLLENNIPVKVFQPETWLARRPLERQDLLNPQTRAGIRYQYAFENSQARHLFLMHNDVFILKDIIGDLKNGIASFFAIGPLGQCWNCPASHEEISRAVMGKGACAPDKQNDYRPDHAQLCRLYELARSKSIFARPYETDNFSGEFEAQPWPLPECRINEWACLLDLQKVRPLCAPFGPAYPPGAFAPLAGHNLDIGVPWLRDMYALGLRAKNFDISKYVKHWVGTGNKSGARYAYSEDRAKKLLEKQFPEYMDWLKGRRPEI